MPGVGDEGADRARRAGSQAARVADAADRAIEALRSALVRRKGAEIAEPTAAGAAHRVEVASRAKEALRSIAGELAGLAVAALAVDGRLARATARDGRAGRRSGVRGLPSCARVALAAARAVHVEVLRAVGACIQADAVCNLAQVARFASYRAECRVNSAVVAGRALRRARQRRVMTRRARRAHISAKLRGVVARFARQALHAVGGCGARRARGAAVRIHIVGLARRAALVPAPRSGESACHGARAGGLEAGSAGGARAQAGAVGGMPSGARRALRHAGELSKEAQATRAALSGAIVCRRGAEPAGQARAAVRHRRVLTRRARCAVCGVSLRERPWRAADASIATGCSSRWAEQRHAPRRASR